MKPKNETIQRMVNSDADETWLLAYHQLILFILVAGRAVMPNSKVRIYWPSTTFGRLEASGRVKETIIKDEVRDSLQKELRRDEKTQLIVGCIGSAADIIEFVSETVGDQPDDLCNSKLHLILWFCWSLRNNSKFLDISIDTDPSDFLNSSKFISIYFLICAIFEPNSTWCWTCWSFSDADWSLVNFHFIGISRNTFFICQE